MDAEVKSQTWQEAPKTLKGYSIINENKCTCRGCNKDLLKIVIVKTSNKIHQVQAICPFCKELTFVTEVKGDIYLGTDEFMYIENIDTKQEGNIFKYKVEVKCQDMKMKT